MEEKSIQAKRTLKDPFVAVQIFLRISAIVVTAVATLFMITNGETIVVFGFKIDVKYSLNPTLKFYVYENMIASGLSFLTSILVVAIAMASSNPTGHYFVLFIHDLMMSVLLSSGVAATAAIGNMGNTGGRKTTAAAADPVALCRYTSKMCNRGEVSVVFSFAGMLIILTLIDSSISRLLLYFKILSLQVVEFRRRKAYRLNCRGKSMPLITLLCCTMSTLIIRLFSSMESSSVAASE
ncbi:hypothetical protein M569_04316 [Genlisea aurea]|uniref:CASP-like protein n=1 Tax=Genlisea aurea TaxID=192259 RepID=S8CUI0_9LAMI|nr:hypothetical protein M569_04316 [Genlisea aurea]